MLKLPLALGTAALCISSSAIPSYAQLGANQNSTFYGVVVSPALGRESDLATLIRNKGNQARYVSGQSVTIWSSEGWIPYLGREDTYVSYDRYMFHPWTANDGTRFWDDDDYRSIRLITGLLTNRPEYRLYDVDCETNGYRLDTYNTYFPSGEILSFNSNVASSLTAPANTFEQTLINNVCAFN